MSEQLPLDARALRSAFGQFATGVTIVATREADGTPRGFTASSFTSVSLDPPLLLVCIANSAQSLPAFRAAPGFTVSVLGERQKDIANLFATRRPDKFAVTAWQESATGLPIIEQSLAWFACATHRQVGAGDHVILIGRVTEFGTGAGRPLAYFGGSYVTAGEANPLVEAAATRPGTMIGAIWERDGAVLFEVDEATGILRVPAVGRSGDPASLPALAKRYGTPAFSTQIDFVYSVFEGGADGALSIYYRGTARGVPPAGTAFVALDAIDTGRIADPACRSMIERFRREASGGTFGLYMGNDTDGTVRRIGEPARGSEP